MFEVRTDFARNTVITHQPEWTTRPRLKLFNRSSSMTTTFRDVMAAGISIFACLKGLGRVETQLSLELSHTGDVKSTIRRTNGTKEAGTCTFGVATECDMGCCPVEESPFILEIRLHVSVFYPSFEFHEVGT
jgi:hypothetical protein